PASTCSSSYFQFSFYCFSHHWHPHSSPPRRSSDLRPASSRRRWTPMPPPPGGSSTSPPPIPPQPARRCRGSWSSSARSRSRWKRSEEHTSELQSRRELVCRLLLEKKKR